MPVQDALRFIGQARQDDALRNKLKALGYDTTLEALVALAQSAGFSITAEELQQAHRYDWTMRWARYHHPGTEKPS